MTKKLYRLFKWRFIQLISFGEATKLVYVRPGDILFGQLPISQFPANKTYKFVRDGDWDKEVMLITDHLLYISYKQHFIDCLPWDQTPLYQAAHKNILAGGKFRGKYADTTELNGRFESCDRLYNEIKVNGYKSNKDLYANKMSNNILTLLDEITINISRDGEYILNDGWHRFITAKLLGLPTVPVRILITHARARKSIQRT